MSITMLTYYSIIIELSSYSGEVKQNKYLSIHLAILIMGRCTAVVVQLGTRTKYDTCTMNVVVLLPLHMNVWLGANIHLVHKHISWDNITK